MFWPMVGLGGAVANQKSTGIGGAGSTVVADGSAQSTAQGGLAAGYTAGAEQLLGKYGLGGALGHGHGVKHGSGLGLVPGAAVSNQESKAHTGPGGTGMAKIHYLNA